MATIVPLMILYFAGWMITVPGMLQRRMLRIVCSKCGKRKSEYHVIPGPGDGWDDFRHGCRRSKAIARGTYRERNGSDAAVAGAHALLWPLMLVWTIFRFTGSRSGRIAKRAILGSAGLTAPERRRVALERDQMIKDQQHEIERLTDEINRKG